MTEEDYTPFTRRQKLSPRQKGELESEVFDFLDKNKIGTIKKIAEKINVNNEEIRKMIHKLHDRNLIKLNKIKKTYFIERLK